MRSFLLAFGILASTLLPARTQSQEIRKGSVVVVPLSGEVTEAQFFFLRRILKKSEAAGASALIIDMDTYGGSLKAAVEMLGALMKSTIPTLTYVNTNAGSAGALIALSTKRVYMAPVSAIGAAAPISAGGEDMQQILNQKVVSYFSGYFRSAAEKNGYNPELAEAFINKEKEVKIGDKVINAKGSLLTLSAQEAVKEYDGKPLLAQGIVSNLEELCEKAGLRAKDIVRMEPTGFERLAQWITILAPLPAAFVGIVCGWLLMPHIPAKSFGPFIGWLTLVLVVLVLVQKFAPQVMNFAVEHPGIAWPFGWLAGSTTMIANAAGPVMTIYLLACRLPKFEFVGTAAWFFFAINLLKVPFSASLGLINSASLKLNLWLAPAVIGGILLGRWLLGKINQAVFEWLMIIFSLLGALRLIFS